MSDQDRIETLQRQVAELEAHLNAGCSVLPGGEIIRFDYLTAELSEGRQVGGCFHDDSYWWRFVNKEGDVTRLRVTSEAMQEMAMIYARLLRIEVDTSAGADDGQ